MMKSLLIAALLALPVAAVAQDAAAPMPAMETMAAPQPLPKCTAKVQDSCDQSTTTEKNALPYYPADSRDAGNNKIAGAKAKPPEPM